MQAFPAHLPYIHPHISTALYYLLTPSSKRFSGARAFSPPSSRHPAPDLSLSLSRGYKVLQFQWKNYSDSQPSAVVRFAERTNDSLKEYPRNRTPPVSVSRAMIHDEVAPAGESGEFCAETKVLAEPRRNRSIPTVIGMPAIGSPLINSYCIQRSWSIEQASICLHVGMASSWTRTCWKFLFGVAGSLVLLCSSVQGWGGFWQPYFQVDLSQFFFLLSDSLSSAPRGSFCPVAYKLLSLTLTVKKTIHMYTCISDNRCSGGDSASDQRSGGGARVPPIRHLCFKF